MRIILIAPAIVALLNQPAYSLDKFEVQEKRAAQERKELEQQHKATLDRIPNQTKKSDPWGSVRSNEPAKKKTN
jgi:hypothetical protein